jgi:hypothetical protein
MKSELTDAERAWMLELNRVGTGEGVEPRRTITSIECDNDDEARKVAANYAAQWGQPAVELCMVRTRSDGREEVLIIGQLVLSKGKPTDEIRFEI